MPEVQAVTPPREYETIYVLRPDAGREASQRVSDRVRDVFTRQEGTLTRVENWGYRKLAYNVQKHTRGVYVYLKYQGNGRLVTELERNLRLQESVIKFQTVATGALIETASAVAAEDVAFEHLDTMQDAGEEFSLARELGLDESVRTEDLLARQRAAEMDDLDNDDEDAIRDSE